MYTFCCGKSAKSAKTTPTMRDGAQKNTLIVFTRRGTITYLLPPPVFSISSYFAFLAGGGHSVRIGAYMVVKNSVLENAAPVLV